MSDEPIGNVDNTTDPEPPGEQPDNAVIRALRQEAKNAGAEARAEADAAKRELAFVKAGIDPDDARQRYFVEGYKGEMTADAIKSEATAAGFLGSVTTSDEGMSEAERAAFTATSQAAAGGPAPAPQTDIYADLRGINPIRSGVGPDQFAQQVAQRVAAAGGDVSDQGPQGPVTITHDGTT